MAHAGSDRRLLRVPMRAGESDLARTRRARRIVRELDATYPDVRCELDFDSPFQLLVATVLSAQTTDKKVNEVTPRLFAVADTPEKMAALDPDEILELIKELAYVELLNALGQLIDLFVLRCEEDDRHFALLAYPAQQLHPVHARHLDVEDGHVRKTLVERVERRLAIVIGLDLEALGLEGHAH